MVKKKSSRGMTDKQFKISLLSVVAIVAVVGLIVMFSGGSSKGISAGDDVVGEGFGKLSNIGSSKSGSLRVTTLPFGGASVTLTGARGLINLPYTTPRLWGDIPAGTYTYLATQSSQGLVGSGSVTIPRGGQATEIWNLAPPGECTQDMCLPGWYLFECQEGEWIPSGYCNNGCNEAGDGCVIPEAQENNESVNETPKAGLN